MPAITIKDLSENTDLDRKAMLAIVGGARRSGYPVAIAPIASGSRSEFKLVDFPSGFGHIPSVLEQSRK